MTQKEAGSTLCPLPLFNLKTSSTDKFNLEEKNYNNVSVMRVANFVAGP
jgi:hypothetical protein